MSERDQFSPPEDAARDIGHRVHQLVLATNDMKDIGESVIAIVDEYRANYVCRDGHRYHMFGTTRLYCRRCGTVRDPDANR